MIDNDTLFFLLQIMIFLKFYDIIIVIMYVITNKFIKLNRRKDG